MWTLSKAASPNLPELLIVMVRGFLIGKLWQQRWVEKANLPAPSWKWFCTSLGRFKWYSHRFGLAESNNVWVSQVLWLARARA